MSKKTTKFHAFVSSEGLIQISLSPITSVVPKVAGDVLFLGEAPDAVTAKRIVRRCKQAQRISAEFALQLMDYMVIELGADFVSVKTHDEWTGRYVETMCQTFYGRSLVDLS